MRPHPDGLTPAPGPDEETQTIRIDSGEQFGKLQSFGREFMPAAAEKLQHHRGERPIFDLFNIEEEIAKAVMFLVDSNFVTGETIRVDGGRHVK